MGQVQSHSSVNCVKARMHKFFFLTVLKVSLQMHVYVFHTFQTLVNKSYYERSVNNKKCFVCGPLEENSRL